jgi:exonuclease SbcC
MKALHLADLHARQASATEALASLEGARVAAIEGRVDVILISGDIWDGPIQNTVGSAFPGFLAAVRALADVAPVAMIYGTPSHDVEGSLEVFEQLQARHGIRILRPGKAYGLRSIDRSIVELVEGAFASHSAWQGLLFGVPEPQKKWLLANGGATGKDAADEAVRLAMRSLLLGLGGLRRQYPDLPCVLLYHGQVSGAKTATGYSASSGIAISKDDLAAVGADYIALGDIHEPQQLFGISAYYPGSCYPLNWGETHQAGANLIEIDPILGSESEEQFDLFKAAGSPCTGFLAKVTRIPFPHPQRVKIQTTHPGLLSSEQVKIIRGALVWWEIIAERGALGPLDEANRLGVLREYGALEGSRVTLNVLPTETVRAAEIAEKTSLREKVQIWGESSALSIPEHVLEKADDLERDAMAGSVGTGAHIRIDRLVLRGAIGIWKKSRKDEIDLNLEAVGPGVLALVGPNGAGKTTILENLHPWPCMLTRDGTLKDHFRLRDSFRDLYFTDERTGTHYRALIQINAATASGSTEYYLSRDTGNGFEPMPGINGRKEPYEAAITALFGSLELYLKTAFQTQRPSKASPDLAEATQGQRKALFGELAGLDYLERYRETCKARADELDGTIRMLDVTIAAAADVDAEYAQGYSAIEENEIAAGIAEKEVTHSLEHGVELRKRVEEAAAKVAEIEKCREALRSAETSAANCANEIAEVTAQIQTYTTAAAEAPTAQRELVRISELETQIAGLRAEKSAIDDEYHGIVAGFTKAMAETNARKDELRARKAEIERVIASIDRKIAALEPLLEKDLDEHCPTCGQLLPEDRRDMLENERAETQGQINFLTAESDVALAKLKSIESELAYIVIPPAPVPPEYPKSAELQGLVDELSWLDKAAADATLAAAREASVRLEDLRRREDKANETRSILVEQIGKLKTEILEADPVQEAHREATEALRAEQENYTAARERAGACRARIEAARAALDGIEKRRDARDAAKAQRADTMQTRDDWRLLERATGPNGIQALELDALAPSIVAVSNALLAEAYGSRYQLEVRTTRIAGKGSKTKQVEDFEIFVLDTESGDEQEIATLSGGEAVWIRKALYDGFAIIRARNTGIRFQTVILDEADGALDPEARMLYLRMLDAAHREAGRFQTILITHSKELQAMVETVVDIGALGPREIAREVA